MSVASLPKTVTRSVSEASLAPPLCRIELRLFVLDLSPGALARDVSALDQIRDAFDWRQKWPRS